jgi:DHA1 family tetracycline resistance protein-like MFS transporter
MRRSPLLFVYLTVFIDLVSFGIILPTLPYAAQQFGTDGLGVGLVVTAYFATQALGAFFLGNLSDRIGRRPVFLISLAGSALSLLCTALSTEYWMLVASGLLAGAFGGSIATGQAMVADLTTGSQRTRALGILGGAIGLSFIFGPGTGAAIARSGLSVAASIAAGLAAANLLLGYFTIRETRPPRAVREEATRVARAVASWSRPASRRLLAAIFLATVAFAVVEGTYALFGKAKFGLGAGGLGLVLSFVGLVIAVFQGFVVGRLNPRYGERTLAIAGSILMGASLVLVPILPNLYLSVACLGVLAAGQSLAMPTLYGLLSRSSGRSEQGRRLGVGQASEAAARSLGPLGAGWLFDQGVSFPYFGGAVLVLIGAALIWTVPRMIVNRSADDEREGFAEAAANSPI